MPYPAGPLPLPGDFASYAANQTPNRSCAIATATAYDFTDPANKVNPCINEFFCTTAGNFVAQLAGDSAGTYRTYVVVAGQIIRGLFTQVSASSTAVGIGRQ